MEILILLFLILLNGVFSMSELALVSSRRFKLEDAARKGSKQASRALALSENPNIFLSTVQIGITLIGILTGIYSGEKIADDLTILLSKVSFLELYARPVSVVVILLIVTFFSIVLGELLPKRIALLFPERIASVLAGPMSLLSKVASPFVWLLTKTNDGLLRLLGISGQGSERISEEEIKSIIRESTATGEIQAVEQRIVERVFYMGDRNVSDLMTHRSEVAWLCLEDSLTEVRRKAAADPQEVYPVSGKSGDDLVGVVALKDLFLVATREEGFRLGDHLKQPLFIHESTPAYHLLEQFQKKSLFYAVVVDEYGSPLGIVSVDDIVSALVGPVSDADISAGGIIQVDERSWMVDAQVPYFEFLAYFRLQHSPVNDEDEYSTVAGLVLHQTKTVPREGDSLRWQGFGIEVAKMEGLRIEKLLFRKGND